MNFHELLPHGATRQDLAESFEIPAAPMPYPASIPQSVSASFYLSPGQLRLNGKTLSWPGRFVQVGSRSEGLIAGVQYFKGDGWLQVYVLPEGNIMVRVVAPASDTPPPALSTFPANTFPLATCLANPLIHHLRDARPLRADSREVLANPESRASLVACFDIPQARHREGVWKPAPGSFYGSPASILVLPGSIQRDDGVTISAPHPLSQNGASVYPSDANLVFGIDLEGPEARQEGRYHPVDSPYEYIGWKVWAASVDAPADTFPVYRVTTDSIGRVIELEDARPAQAGMEEM
jgi:hypothetical protein